MGKKTVAELPVETLVSRGVSGIYKVAQAFVFVSGAAILLPACAPHAAGPTQAQLNTATNDSTNWLYVDHDYRGQRYTPLDQITAKNAADH